MDKEFHLEVIVYRNQRHLKGVKVSACGKGFFGGFTKTVYTDTNGYALLMTLDNAKYTVYIDGREKGDFSSPGKYIFHI